MTLKRDKRREVLRKQLMEKEQETTHSLVSKFSKEMLNLIQEKELAALVCFISILVVLFLALNSFNRLTTKEADQGLDKHLIG